MAQVHPSAIIDGDVELAPDVVVGPQCVLTAPRGHRITIGSGTRLLGHAYLTGPLVIGERNTIHPFTTIGHPPQDLKWDPDAPGAGVRIGNQNTFREGASIHRATAPGEPTTIGNNNYWMANSHAAHDCRVGDGCIIANGALLAGFVRVDDRAVLGGNVAVHQFCRVGRGTMLSGTVGLSMDLPPFFMLTGLNVAGSLNLIGMRRSGMTSEQINTVRWVYRTLYRQGLPPQRALQRLIERAEDPLVHEYIDFIRSSKRGICKARGKATRGFAAAGVEESE